MKTRPRHATSLRSALDSGGDCASRFLWDAASCICLSDLLTGTTLGTGVDELSGKTVLLATRSQLAAAAALIGLDGVAHRIIVCTPDLPPEHLPSLVARGGVDAIVSDGARVDDEPITVALRVACGVDVIAAHPHATATRATEWVLLTSGTTGAPKMVVHTLETLTAPIDPARTSPADVWGTFYDIRRYGGLQIFLRAMLGAGSLILSNAAEAPAAFLGRLASHGVTHLSGTPSHWRRVLMSSASRDIAPQYVRLSGEIADQSILNTLRSTYAPAAVGHAFASTEAGVAFEVNDGLDGFPASLVGIHGDVEIEVDGGSLRIRSPRIALGYLGETDTRLTDERGFVDTGDMVERRGDRYYFLGRRSGVINVGGLKVYPEEIEAAINRHPAVRMSVVRSRKSPITGSLVAADVVLKDAAEAERTDRTADLRREILDVCREVLPPHKLPATIRFVPAVDVAAAGKVARNA